MKIISLNGSLPNYNYGLDKLNKIVYDTLSELGIEVEEINLSQTNIPYYDGSSSDKISILVEKLKECNGVIFSTGVSAFSTGAALQKFASHLEFGDYKDVLKNKNCLMVLACNDSGLNLSVLKPAIDYFSNFINYCGGFETIKITILSKYLEPEYLKSDNEISDFKEIIEKQVEDYYRLVRQNRRFVLNNRILKMTENMDEVSDENIDTNNENDKDIDEITQFFANKYSSKFDKKINNIFNEEISENDEIIPRIKTCKQLTSSLPHYFQPQNAVGLEKIILLDINGSEIFSGVLTIKNGECFYTDGKVENPDISITTDDKTWSDILNCKITPQKTFMMGQLKVRGDFVLLTRFETLFNFSG